MLKSICSSKLYAASSRKDRIHAAMIAPGNLSLVQQLADDLDEEYKTPENLGREPEGSKSDGADENNNYNDLFDDESINPETDLMTVDDLAGDKSSSSHSVSHRSTPPAKPESNEGPEGEPADNSELMPDSPATEIPEKEEKPVEESTQIKSTTIIKPEERVNLDILKGSLNGRDDTKGVTRAAEKENEIWVYYDDDVNLNNTMTAVIEYLANAGFDALEFNRLARSDNAIVFDLIKQTSRPNRQMEEVAE